jgi:hypothetical protein
MTSELWDFNLLYIEYGEPFIKYTKLNWLHVCILWIKTYIRTTVLGSEDFTVTEIKIMVVWIMTLSELIDSLDFSHRMY